MKTMRILKSALFALSLTFVGCMDNDVYNPDRLPDNGGMTDLVVPSDFPWSTTAKVTVNVNVNGKSNQTYNIFIYPQGAGEKTLPLTTGVAKGGTTYSETITIPASDTIVSVMQTMRYKDGGIAKLQYSAPIINGKANVNSGNASVTRAATRGNDDDCPELNDADKKAIKNATKISGTTVIDKKDNNAYLVEAGTSYTLNVKNNTDNITIYVAGTMDVSDGGSTKNLNSGRIVVLNQKQIKEIVGTDADESGKIIGNNFTLKSGLRLVNYGIVNITDTDIQKGNIVVEIGAEVHTWGCISGNNIIIGDNKAKSTTRGNGSDDAVLHIEESGYVKTNTMYIGASDDKIDISLNQNSLLEIKETLTFKGKAEIEAEGNKMDNSQYVGVIKVGDIIKTNGASKELEFEDPLFIICENEKPTYVTLDDGATWGNEEGAANIGIKIPSNGCFSGYIPNDNESGEDPDPKEEVTTPGIYSYAFEDLWPNYGDYDMNDLVLVADPKVYSTNGIISKIELNYKIIGIGASKSIAAAVQCDDVKPDAIKSIEYNTTNNFPKKLFLCNPNGTESSQKLAVIPLFDDAHTFAGVSGISGTRPNDTFAGKEFTVTIYLQENSTRLAQADLDNWNYFITCNAAQGKRMEIHLIDGKATDLFDPSTIGGVVSSASTPFKAKNNLCWAMRIPNEFHFPLENNDIRQSFEEFESWITDPTYAWYENPIPGKVK